jgi:Rrf2 family protein
LLGIGRHTDYASRIVLHLALLPAGERVTASEIAGKRLLPAPYIRRIIGKLAAAGIVRTARGWGGGVALARPASRISMLDLVDAMEGGVVLNACVRNPAACPLAKACPVRRAWAGVSANLARDLGRVRFDQLARSLKPPVVRGRPPATAGRSRK